MVRVESILGSPRWDYWGFFIPAHRDSGPLLRLQVRLTRTSFLPEGCGNRVLRVCVSRVRCTHTHACITDAKEVCGCAQAFELAQRPELEEEKVRAFFKVSRRDMYLAVYAVHV